jgi:hypothetical protein
MIAFLTRRRVAIPATLALVVLGLTVLGDLDPGGWVALTPAYEHSTFTTVLICILLIVALAGIRTTNRWLSDARTVLATTLAFIAVVALLLTQGFFSQDLRVQQQIAAPDGRPYRLVVAEGNDVIDPVWTLAIRNGNGLTAREWRFGCLNGDASDYALTSAAWDGPAQVVVTIGDDPPRRVVVPIDIKTGRPAGSASTWDGCDAYTSHGRS